jgi:hypothetical protein
VRELTLFVDFHDFYVADAVGVVEHRSDTFISVFGFAGGQVHTVDVDDGELDVAMRDVDAA